MSLTHIFCVLQLPLHLSLYHAYIPARACPHYMMDLCRSKRYIMKHWFVKFHFLHINGELLLFSECTTCKSCSTEDYITRRPRTEGYVTTTSDRHTHASSKRIMPRTMAVSCIVAICIGHMRWLRVTESFM